MESSGVQITRLVGSVLLHDEPTADTGKVYLNDSMGQRTFAYDFDLEAGTISNRRMLIDFRGSGGEPDGMVLE